MEETRRKNRSAAHTQNVPNEKEMEAKTEDGGKKK